MSNLTRRSHFPGFEPYSALSLFEDSLNRFFSEAPSDRPWSPAVDIAENENELVLTADIPGVQMGDIDIRLEDGTLTLTGSRKFENEEKKSGYHRIERSYGSFRRVFALPDSIESEMVSASYENGVLKVMLPKKEIAKPRSIKVELGSKN